MNTYSNWLTHLEQVLFDLFDMEDKEFDMIRGRLRAYDNICLRELYESAVTPEEAAKYFV